MKIELPDNLFCEEELKNTPQRYERFLNEWFKSHDFKFTTFKNPGYSELIMQKVPFFSMCSHHLLPFFGNAYIGYIPNDGLLCGFSKLSRLVDKFAHKPQMQEKMTKEIGEFLDSALKSKGTMCVIQARHLCMEMRGVNKLNSHTTTSYISGVFKDPTQGSREEFLRLIKNDI